MTTEETLCNIARNNALIFTEEEQDAIAEAILAMQELEWYRKQNLIRREDAIKLCDCNYFEKGGCIRIKFADNCENCYWHIVKSRDIKQIPKAEPNIPKENV